MEMVGTHFKDDLTNQALTWNPHQEKRKLGRPKTILRRKLLSELEDEKPGTQPICHKFRKQEAVLDQQLDTWLWEGVI